MQVNVPTLVWDELAEAALYYERQSSGLGAELMQELSACLEEIASDPERPPGAETGIPEGESQTLPVLRCLLDRRRTGGRVGHWARRAPPRILD